MMFQKMFVLEVRKFDKKHFFCCLALVKHGATQIPVSVYAYLCKATHLNRKQIYLCKTHT